MEENYRITKALESNLNLIVDDAKDLAMIFKDNEAKKAVYDKIIATGTILLYGVRNGDFSGSEKELFHATLPLCQKLCKEWHEYKFLL